MLRSYLTSFTDGMRSALHELAVASDGKARPTGDRRRTFMALANRTCAVRLSNEDGAPVYRITANGRAVAAELEGTAARGNIPT
jgi:hypothetical protein